jgi:hypothetical protein
MLNSQGKYEAAEELHQQVLEPRQKVLGLQHPDSLTGMNNFAGATDSQRKYETAEEMYRQVLEPSGKCWAPSAHPHR